MNIEEVRSYTLSLPGVTEDQPFGEDNVTFRVEGKIFLCLWLGREGQDWKGGPRFACKLPPDRNETLRLQYEAVTPAFHWNKKHWSDVYYEQLATPLVRDWIRGRTTCSSANCPKCSGRNISERHTAKSLTTANHLPQKAAATESCCHRKLIAIASCSPQTEKAALVFFRHHAAFVAY